ncbi:uncharacterized protein LOC119740168 [Patiria miniata]|uniref:LamG-like jellyroll fold domain-containing protein n=1 Tax=Patiria miniata TaxID=46514 RepID=A0A914B5U5_PATMI|nr:uncharacterized protein LOC119740168 [Patiria miniata]
MAVIRVIFLVALAVVVAPSAHVLACTSSVSVNIGVSEAAQCAYVFSLDQSQTCGACPTLQEAMHQWLALQGGLIAHYKFDENLLDSTANERHGSLVDSEQVTYADGQCGKAAVFNGASKVVVDAFRNHPWGSQFSVSVWFKRTENRNTYQGIVNTGFGSYGSWEIRMGRELSGEMLGGGVVTLDSPAIWNYINLRASLGDWHHVVMTYDGSQLLFYLDNQLQSGDNTCCHGNIVSKDTPLTIGQAGVGTAIEFFVGWIDEVKIFNKALSRCEVDKLFNTPCSSEYPSRSRIASLNRRTLQTIKGGATSDLNHRAPNQIHQSKADARTVDGMAVFRVIFLVVLAVVVAPSAHVFACTSSVSVNIGVSEAAQCAYVFSLDQSQTCGACPTLQEAMRQWLALQGGLIAHYKFDENLLDSTANERHGSQVDVEQVTYADGQCGKAAVFNGASKVVVDAFRNHPWGSQFSVSVWFKRTENRNTYQGIVNTGYHSIGSWEIRMGRELSGEMLGGGVVTLDSTATWNYANLRASLGDWHHVVMTYDGSQLLFYMDNQLQSGDNTCCHGNIISKDTPLTIGQAGVGTAIEFFVGLIDEVKIFNKALSRCEVDKLFNTPCSSE